MDTLKKAFAAKLLRIKAIKLQPNNPFTWASGWKSPFYCDNRKTLSYPELRNYVKLEIVHAVLEKFPEVEAIAGVATGAIPQGALVADALNLPFVYVRSKPKDHGLENLIEGELKPGMKVVVIEDLISTGGSSLKAVEAIRNNACEVIGMVASYTYGFPVAKKAFKEANVELVTLTDYEHVVAEALETGYIADSEHRREKLTQTARLLGITGRVLSPTESKYIGEWLEMGFDDELIEMALDRTITNTGGLKWGYMNGILKSWHEKGLHTPADVRDRDGTGKRGKGKKEPPRDLGRLIADLEKI